LSKRFGSADVLQPTTLTVDQGEFFTLLGPSGCGKTTLLRIISGFETASGGHVELRGQRLDRVPPERRPFNMVFQSYALFPHMTVAENAAYGLRIAGRPAAEIRERVGKALDLVHLREAGDRPVTQLSGGQQQRVALARALINEPQVLLLDEPLGALDLKLRKYLQSELSEIQRRLGTTFIYVTHDQEEALTLSHRIALVNEGRVVQLGTPREVYERPNSRFSADFVGETNLLSCDVARAPQGGAATVRFKLCEATPVELHYFGADALSEGEPALAALRPEDLEFCPPGEGHFSGLVRRSLFLGTHSRHEVELEDGQTVRVSSPAFSGTPSERIDVRIQPGRGVVVRDDGAGTTPEGLEEEAGAASAGSYRDGSLPTALVAVDPRTAEPGVGTVPPARPEEPKGLR
jgi:spermidine/putrescine transport system ATP-binding protein